MTKQQEVPAHLSVASNSKLLQLRDQFMQDFYYKRNNQNDLEANPSSLSSVILKECVVCMSGVADGVLMPCGHSGICYDCAIQMLQKEESQVCHLCRENIEQILKVDMRTVFKDYIRVIESA